MKTDPIGLLDDATHAGAGAASKTATDSVGLTDPLTRAVAYVRTRGDALTLLDSVARAGAGGRTSTSSLLLVDDVTRTAVLARVPTDAVWLLDSVVVVWTEPPVPSVIEGPLIVVYRAGRRTTWTPTTPEGLLTADNPTTALQDANPHATLGA